MAEVLQVAKRDSHGKRNSRRLRRSGRVPAILYGHKEACVPLSVSCDQLTSAVRRGSRVVELAGAVNEKALIRELQWDVYGIDVLHADFTRVSEHERVHVKVVVELKGQAAGAKDGGLVEHVLHELEIECEALSIPEKFDVNIRDLAIGGSILAGDVPLSPGVTLLTDADLVVVHCVEPVGEVAAAGIEAGVAEPEVIGRKAEEEEEEEK